VVEGRERVQALAAEIVKGYEGFLKVLRPWVLALLRPFMSKVTHQQFRDFIIPLARSYVSDRRQGKDTLFWDAPAVLIFYHSPYAQAADVAIACTYAMLAAESLGLGTTIIGGAPPMLQRQKKLCRRIGIPENSTPAFALIIGHPAIRFRHAIQRHFLDERN
jgi:nitroreductase